MGDNLAGNLVEAGRAHAARPAIVDGGAIISYATLDDLTARASQLLRARGVGEGDRVGLMFPNVPECDFQYL